VQPFGDHRGEAGLVAVEDVDEFEQRADSFGVGGPQWRERSGRRMTRHTRRLKNSYVITPAGK
jgi:hypothetical protein